MQSIDFGLKYEQRNTVKLVQMTSSGHYWIQPFILHWSTYKMRRYLKSGINPLRNVKQYKKHFHDDPKPSQAKNSPSLWYTSAYTSIYDLTVSSMHEEIQLLPTRGRPYTVLSFSLSLSTFTNLSASMLTCGPFNVAFWLDDSDIINRFQELPIKHSTAT